MGIASDFPAADHDHTACRAQALAQAEAQCAAQGLRLTATRRRVLEILWDDHCPITAYDILDRLNEAMRAQDPTAKRQAPPVVYRALDFLMANGLAHKLNSLNAYVGCTHPGRSHGAQFFICRACKRAVELRGDTISSAISSAAERLGFQVQAPLVEVEGLCQHCQPSQPSLPPAQ